MSNKRLSNWIKKTWDWFAEGKIVFMAIFVIFAIVIWVLATGSSEPKIRTAGYFLQLIGMIFAIRGLLFIREHFGQPLLRSLFVDWLKRFPKWKNNIVIGAGAAMASASGMKARAEVWTKDNPSLAIEERIAGIVRNLEQIRNEQSTNSIAIDELKDSHEKHKRELENERKMLEERIQSDLESLHTSDLLTSLVGLVWLTVGITFSTLAPELNKWII